MKLDITLTTPDGRKFISPQAFELVEVPPPPLDPIIESIDPISGPKTGGTLVTIRGKHFPQGATILFGDKPALNVQVAADGLSLTCVTPSFA